MTSLTPLPRKLLTVVVAITAVVLVSLIAWNVTASHQGASGQPFPWLAAAVIGFGVVAAFAIYFQTARVRRAAQLEPDYYRTYEQVVEWLCLSTLSQREQAEVLEDVLGLLHHAQASSRPSAAIVGDDPADFVRRIQESHGYRDTTAFWALNSLSTLAWLLPVVQAGIWLMQRFETTRVEAYFDTPVGISLIPYMVVLVAVVLPLTRTFLARGSSGGAVALLLGLAASFVVISRALRRFAYDQLWVRTFLDGEAIVVGSWSTGIIWAAVFAATLLARSYLRRVSLRDLRR